MVDFGLGWFWVKVAALVVMFVGGISIGNLTVPFVGSVDLGILALPVTLLWIVGVTNAFNIIDGLDGLAAALDGGLDGAWRPGRTATGRHGRCAGRGR